MKLFLYIKLLFLNIKIKRLTKIQNKLLIKLQNKLQDALPY